MNTAILICWLFYSQHINKGIRSVLEQRLEGLPIRFWQAQLHFERVFLNSEYIEIPHGAVRSVRCRLYCVRVQKGLNSVLGDADWTNVHITHGRELCVHFNKPIAVLCIRFKDVNLILPNFLKALRVC